MPQSITFPKLKPQWIFDRECVQFFAAVDGEQVLKCFVSAEALYTHFGAREFSMEEATRAFLEHRDEIEAVARERILKGNYKSGNAVFLRTADFPRQPITAASPPARGLCTVIAPAVSESPALLNSVKEANAFLEQVVVTPSRRTTATWEPVPNESLVQLTLADDETEATVINLYSARDLANRTEVRSSLLDLWDGLLQERLRRRLEELQGVSNAGGEASER